MREPREYSSKEEGAVEAKVSTELDPIEISADFLMQVETGERNVWSTDEVGTVARGGLQVRSPWRFWFGAFFEFSNPRVYAAEYKPMPAP